MAATILVIDDDRRYREALVRVLDRAGYLVVEADSVATGWDKALQYKPDLIILDRVLPDGDGLALCTKIKGCGHLHQTFVVLLSGLKITPSDTVEGLAASADAYFVRPISNEEVIARVRALLRAQQAEMRLRASEESLRSLLDNSPDVILRINGQRCIEYANKATERLLELNIGKISGKPYADLFAQVRELNNFIDLVENVFSSGAQETALVRWDVGGKVLLFEVRLQPEVGRSGSTESLLVFARDITDKQIAFEHLAEANARTAGIVETVPVGITIVSKDGAITFANSAAERILDLSRSTITSRTFDDPQWKIVAIDGSPFPSDELPVARVLRTKKPAFNIEHAIEFDDGRRVPLLINAAPVLDDSGEVTEVVASISDIGERVRAERKLKDDEELLRSIIETTQEGFWLVDRQGFIKNVNNAYLTMSGYTRKEILSMHVNELENQETKEATRRHIQHVCAAGGDRFESVHRAKDGRLFTVDVSANYLPEADCIMTFIRDVTSEKARQEELTKNERRLSMALDATRTGLWDWNLTTNEVYRSESLHSLTGYSAREFQGNLDGWKRLLHPDDAPRVAEVLDAHVRGETEHFEVEYRLKHASGEWRWILDAGRCFSDANGGDCHMIGTITDVTPRYDMEERLRSTLQQLQVIIESSPLAIVATDTDFNVTLWNKAAEKIFGWRSDEVLQGKIPVVPPEKYQELLELSSRVADGEPVRGMEVERVDKAGNRIFLRLSKAPLYGRTGGIDGYLGIYEDVTEMRKQQEQLRVMIQAVEQSPAMLLLTDKDGNIEYANPSLCNTTGYTFPELIGKNPRVFQSGKTEPHVYEEMWRTITSGIPWQGEFCNRRKNGEEYWESVFISPVTGSGGHTRHYLAIKEDITTERQAKAELSSLELQLRQAQKMESLGTLASGIAHDFNNILGIILGNISLLESLDDREEVQRSINAVITSVERGAGLVKQILTFARKTGVDLSPLHMNATLKEMASLLRSTFPQSVEIRLDVEKDLPVLTLDGTQFHQVLLNLCVNARDAILDKPEVKGYGTITLESSLIARNDLVKRFPAATANNYVRVGVRDTGTGVPDEVRQRMFDPFYTTKPAGKGTGLGLAVVYGVLKSHDAFIDLESEVGKGAVFMMYFPVTSNGEQKINGQLQKGASALRGTETVLLVEDEELLRTTFSKLLEGQGYTVLVAGDGLQGLKIFADNKDSIRLVISDMSMPHMGGLDLLKYVKNTHASTGFILSSGFIGLDERTSLYDAGADEVLQKPYQFVDLLTNIRRVLDTSGVAA